MAQTTTPDRLPTTRPTAPSTWRATRHLTPLPRPPVDPELDAPPKMGPDGRIIKKVRPRRTIDLWAGVARWEMIKKVKPVGTRVPVLKPAASYIIDMLPPKAYTDDIATSITTKFVHTSTNKVRCPVNCVVWTPEGRRPRQCHSSARIFSFWGYLISADQSGVIKYYQPNMNNVAAWQAHREAVRGVSFAPSDSRFASCGDDASVRIWSFEDMREERCITGHGWDVKCVEWHPTRGLIVSGSKDNLVKFWDPRSGQNLSTLHYHKNTIQAIKWNPNGNLVATASRDQTVRVFDIRAMKELHVLKGHKKEVCSLTWHPVHHDLLVSGGAEGSIYFWTLSSSTPSAPRATMDQAHESNVWALAYHPLGHILCTGSNDHTTRFWCRDRPGEGLSGTATSAMEESTEDDGYDALPGFGMASSGMNMTGQDGGQGGMEWEVGNVRPGTGAWGTQGGDEFIPGFGKSTLPASNDNGGSGSGRAPPPPGFGMDDVYDNRGGADVVDMVIGIIVVTNVNSKRRALTSVATPLIKFELSSMYESMSLTRILGDFEPLFRLVEEPRTHSQSRQGITHTQRQAVTEFSEEEKEYVVRAELPGVQKKDLDIHVGNDGRSLTIEGRVHRTNKPQTKESGEGKEVSKDASGPAETYEYRSTFSRTVWFPQAVEAKNARAKLEDGILTLNIPKREETGTQRISLL
ncbi:WD40 repeat-like protein [Rhizoctonia solani]|uniref:Polyadenylation factor subunit 2 n=1 Tax=Rhizoctonia solani TaxID=456999 RepID=A0A8H7ID66_9AGAM|nr:WD40 repeat-like protein [Rhizoctonia solani]